MTELREKYSSFFEALEGDLTYKDEAVYFLDKLLNIIYNKMKSENITQASLARKLGVTPSAVSQFFGCYDGNLSIVKIFKYATALGITITITEENNNIECIAQERQSVNSSHVINPPQDLSELPQGMGSHRAGARSDLEADFQLQSISLDSYSPMAQS